MRSSQKNYISIVMPCLNEEKAVGKCVKAAIKALKLSKIRGEIIVSDNGSTDRSKEVAVKAGARVVNAKETGYGAAYLKGLSATKGNILIMGDSDGTYDFSQIPDFVKKIEEGYQFVNGSRLKGDIAPGAFSFTHRYIGVPILTGLLNRLFGTKFSDAHCGMRAFTREAYEKMDLRCRGMEFASEMIVKAAGANIKSTEIPIRYLPRIGKSKLVSVRDTWRHTRFMLLFAPTFLFFIPGSIFLFTGLGGLIILLPGPVWLGKVGFDIHTMLFASLLSVLGLNILSLGLFAKLFALFGNTGLIRSRTVKFFMNNFSQNTWLKIGLAIFLVGLFISIYVFSLWVEANFKGISEMRLVVLAVTLIILGVQTIFASFFASLLIDRYKRIL